MAEMNVPARLAKYSINIGEKTISYAIFVVAGKYDGAGI
jgi:hypothetical protein